MVKCSIFLTRTIAYHFNWSPWFVWLLSYVIHAVAYHCKLCCCSYIYLVYYDILMWFFINKFCIVQIADINLTHIESRPSQSNPGETFDFFTSCSDCSQEKVNHLLGLIKPLVTSVVVEEAKDEGTSHIHSKNFQCCISPCCYKISFFTDFSWGLQPSFSVFWCL